MLKCKNCQKVLESDGYGEHIHEESGKYGCEPGSRDKEYPVAS